MRLGQRKADHDKVLTKRQVAALLYGAHQMATDPPTSPKPWAFSAFLLMYLLGLRIGEARLLKYAHIGKRDVNGLIRSIRVPTEKKPRADGAPKPKGAAAISAASAAAALSELREVPVISHHPWLAKAFDPRTRRGRASLSEWLFPSPMNPSKPVSKRTIEYAFNEAAARAGLPTNYSSHALRHTAATELARCLARRGFGELETEAWVGAFLRHSPNVTMNNQRTTQKYIHLAPRDIREWATLIPVRVLDLATPFAPVGPSRYSEEARFANKLAAKRP